MTQLWEVPSVGKGGKVKVLTMMMQEGESGIHEVSRRHRKVLCFH